MGIAAVIGAVLKNVSWGKVASLAMEYAPGLYQQAKERFKREEEPAEASPVETELQERISRLEKLLLEQEAVIREQVAKNELLEESCRQLEGRVNLFRIIAVILAGIALVPTFLLLRS